MVAYFFTLAFRKVVFSSQMLHKVTFSECQILRLQNHLISAATLQIIKGKIIPHKVHIISVSRSSGGSSISHACFSQAKCFMRERSYSGGARLSV